MTDLAIHKLTRFELGNSLVHPCRLCFPFVPAHQLLPWKDDKKRYCFSISHHFSDHIEHDYGEDQKREINFIIQLRAWGEVLVCCLLIDFLASFPHLTGASIDAMFCIANRVKNVANAQWCISFYISGEK